MQSQREIQTESQGESEIESETNLKAILGAGCVGIFGLSTGVAINNKAVEIGREISQKITEAQQVSETLNIHPNIVEYGLPLASFIATAYLVYTATTKTYDYLSNNNNNKYKQPNAFECDSGYIEDNSGKKIDLTGRLISKEKNPVEFAYIEKNIRENGLCLGNYPNEDSNKKMYLDISDALCVDKKYHQVKTRISIKDFVKQRKSQ